ncbi:hypothetical protein B0H10DRAFT_1944585 [Mycena sp. CBHHK59/15]|nr:hypothetical protein B0H10DRAFT_1944585 [Mycena sp. CBHHK59/15]
MNEPITPFGVFPSVVPRGTGSSPPMPPCPTDLDVTSLTSTSGSQLDFWIDAANRNAGKKALVKTGKVNVRRNRLVDYYGLDLSNIPVTPSIGPIPRDKAINKMPWAHLRTLGAEWAAKTSTGIPFQLVEDDTAVQPSASAPHHELLPSIKSAINETLASATGITFQGSTGSTGSLSESEHPGGNCGNMDVETIQAVIKSAKEGDIASISTLFKLQASITDDLPVAPDVLSQQTSVSFHPSSSSATPNLDGSFSSAATSHSLLTTSLLLAAHVEPSTSLDSIILASGSISVEALNRADNLCDVIAQHESRAVANIRKLYGPQKGCATNPMWAKIKVTITLRERLAVELESEFKGDKRTIPHSDKDLHAEQQLEEYQNNGVFSEDLWMQKWDGQKKWEIW